MVCRTVTFSAAAFFAAALVGLGAGSAVADDFGPDCEVRSGSASEDGVRNPAIQGELRSAGDGEVLAQGSVNGDTSRIQGRALPEAASAEEFGGAMKDFSSDTAALPGTSGFLDEVPNPCG